MLSFTFPWVVAGAAAAALLLGVLHLLSVRRPPILLLPTARFVPQGDSRAVALGPRPVELVLLAMRALAILLAGMAFGGARCHVRGPRAVQLIIADQASQPDSAAWWAAVAGSARGGASEVRAGIPHVAWVSGLETDPGAALVAGQREAGRLAQLYAGLEEVELTIVLPRRVRSLRGWRAWRSRWPGGIRVVDVGKVEASSAGGAALPRAVSVVSTIDDDPVEAAFNMSAMHPVVILRDSSVNVSDFAESGTVLVHWPGTGAPEGWHSSPAVDTVGAVTAMETALVGSFERSYVWRDEDGQNDTAVGIASGGGDGRSREILWWADGEPAAVEVETSGGCERRVYLPIPQGSDLLLGAAAAGVRGVITAPCGAAQIATEPLSDSVAEPVDARIFRDGGSIPMPDDQWWITLVLLGMALVVLLTEQKMRSRGKGPA